MLVGKCLCGVVRYSVEGPFRYAGYCHCSRCRAGSGSTCSAFAGIEKDRLRVTDGDESITLFELRNPDNIRSFCRLCGSQLFALVRDGQFLHVTMGTLVDDPVSARVGIPFIPQLRLISEMDEGRRASVAGVDYPSTFEALDEWFRMRLLAAPISAGSLADQFLLPRLWGCRRAVGNGRWLAAVPGMPQGDLDNRRHDIEGTAAAADMVPGDLVRDQPKNG